MKKILSSKRGELYIEAVISLMVIAMFMVFALSAYRVSVVKTQADSVADQLLEVATFYGCFGDEYERHLEKMQTAYSDLNLEVTYDGEWYNVGLKRVQLGDMMQITVTYEVTFGGFGTFITLPLTTTRVGVSENYWKTA